MRHKKPRLYVSINRDFLFASRKNLYFKTASHPKNLILDAGQGKNPKES